MTTDDVLLASVMRRLLRTETHYANWGGGINPPNYGIPWVAIDARADITPDELAAIERATQP